jgi:hypothetical protein
MSSMPGGIGQGLGTSSSFGSKGATGLGGGMRTMPGSGTRGMGVMPPNFGYPFRQPPGLVSPSTSGTGMSM